MRSILRTIDNINDKAGSAARWLCPALVLLITLEVTRRFVFNSPSMWAFETAMMVGATLYVFGWAYVHRHRAHVRVDVFYAHLPRRMQALIDILGNIVFFFPFIIMFTIAAVNKAQYSWAVNEANGGDRLVPAIRPTKNGNCHSAYSACASRRC